MRFFELLWNSALKALPQTVLATVGYGIIVVFFFGPSVVELIAFAATLFTLATSLNLRRLC